MNISEALEFAIETAQSGRPGAAVKLLQSVVIALKQGKTTDFFQAPDRKELAALAQDLAFREEEDKKRIGSVFVQDGFDEPDCVA